MDDYRDLDPLFVLPEYVEGHWRGDYEVLVARLRGEARGLPMNTIQQLLIERIACLYVEIRWREALPLDAEHGWTFRMTSDANRDWLGLAREFNDALRKFRAATPEAMVEKIKTVIVTAVGETVRDTGMQSDLMSRIQSGFSAEGL